MTDLTALKELLERVEKAEGPDREIDAAVYVALFIPHERAGRIDIAGGCVGWWPKDGPYESSVKVDRYTSSIDACVALIEKVLPGWHYTVDSSLGEVQLFHPEWPAGPSTSGNHDVLPFALLAALLSALIAKEESNA